MRYKTRHLYFAAALHALGRKLITVTTDEDRKQSFWFDDSDDQCASLDAAYFGRTFPPLQPHDVIDALVTVRRAMYAAR